MLGACVLAAAPGLLAATPVSAAVADGPVRAAGAVSASNTAGGMLAIRYALMYPHETQQLVLVNPIGLEDWKAKGVPSLSVDQWYERELKTTADGIRRYEQATYYAGQWRADYEPWVQMLAGMYRGPGKQIVAWNSALAVSIAAG
jgi:pimeloyl-ACP methyl ester carboxylesterase